MVIINYLSYSSNITHSLCSRTVAGMSKHIFPGLKSVCNFKADISKAIFVCLTREVLCINVSYRVCSLDFERNLVGFGD